MKRLGAIRKYSRPILFCITAGWLLAFVSTARSAEPEADSSTVTLLKRWDGDADATLSTLFATGLSRELELAEVCHGEDQELHAKAYFVLLLIGSTATADCAHNLSVEGQPSILLTGDVLTEADLDRVNKLVVDSCERNQDCKKDDCPEVDESLGYALMLNGSNRALTLAKRIAALFKTCHGEDLMAAEPFLKPESMRNAPSNTRNLQLDAANFAMVMKQSAFFVPEDWQKAVSVKLLARNEEGGRMLLEISYRCGMRCGSGYYVVLKKNAAGNWDYVLVSRAWIS